MAIGKVGKNASQTFRMGVFLPCPGNGFTHMEHLAVEILARKHPSKWSIWAVCPLCATRTFFREILPGEGTPTRPGGFPPPAQIPGPPASVAMNLAHVYQNGLALMGMNPIWFKTLCDELGLKITADPLEPQPLPGS